MSHGAAGCSCSSYYSFPHGLLSKSWTRKRTRGKKKKGPLDEGKSYVAIRNHSHRRAPPLPVDLIRGTGGVSGTRKKGRKRMCVLLLLSSYSTGQTGLMATRAQNIHHLDTWCQRDATHAGYSSEALLWRLVRARTISVRESYDNLL